MEAASLQPTRGLSLGRLGVGEGDEVGDGSAEVASGQLPRQTDQELLAAHDGLRVGLGDRDEEARGRGGDPAPGKGRGHVGHVGEGSAPPQVPRGPGGRDAQHAAQEGGRRQVALALVGPPAGDLRRPAGALGGQGGRGPLELAEALDQLLVGGVDELLRRELLQGRPQAAHAAERTERMFASL